MTNINTPDRQEIERKLAAYGKVMHELFKFLIALHRFSKACNGRYEKLSPQDQMARTAIVRTVAQMQRFLGPDDRTKLKRFSIELTKANLADSEDTIIEDVLHRLGVQRLST